MVQWSPDTPYADPSGYAYSDSSIQEFSLTHFNGAGCANNEDVAIMPAIGPLVVSPADHWGTYSAGFSHAREHASAGYYGVWLEPANIHVELTAATHAGLGQFTFPAAPQAILLFNASHNAAGMRHAQVNIVSDTLLEGAVEGGNFCNSQKFYTVYFAAAFDRPFASYGAWDGGAIQPGGRQASSDQAGVYVAFDTSHNPVVRVKIGLSFVSASNALANLQADIPDFDFAAARGRVRETWNRRLGQVQVQGGTDDQKTIFYTALYHVFINPNVFSDVNGQYIGFDQQIHTAQGYTQYANFSGWDIYRGWVQLAALLAPQETSDMLQSLVMDASQGGGGLPKWSQNNLETGVMVGDPGTLVVANGYAFGAQHFNTATALQAMLNTATRGNTALQGVVIRPRLKDYIRDGFIPALQSGSAAITLEYTNADYALAQFALALGDQAAYQKYLDRSQNWKNLFNTQSGYIQARNPDRSWSRPFDPGSAAGFVEGSAAQYTWMVPFDLKTLFQDIGGRDQAIRRLDTFFTRINAGPDSPYAYMGNEPSFAVPWEYVAAGAPWGAQVTLRRIMTELYNSTPGGLPGNDDLGAMSSWYVWAALGMYPVEPGLDVLVLGSPLFPAATIHLENGASISISANVLDAGGPYVQRLTVNGQDTRKLWLHFSAIATGGQLVYTLGSTPNLTLGVDPADAPP